MIRRFDHRSMRFRLILTIGLILLVFQVISVVWLWHESKEQIQFLVEAQLQSATWTVTLSVKCMKR